MKKPFGLLLFLSALLGLNSAATAGPVGFGIWYEFSTNFFLPPPKNVQGCDPAHPFAAGGAFCLPSSGTPTTFADAPPWTFAAPATGAVLTVTDAFDSGDILDVFDFGALIGTTSFSSNPPFTFCGDDPVPCLASPTHSHGLFALGAGAHSITFLESDTATFPGGAHYFRVDAQVVAEPGTLLLAALGLGGLAALRRRR